MKAIAWAVAMVGCLAVSVYAGINDRAIDSGGCFIWACICFGRLVAQPSDKPGRASKEAA